MAIMEGVVDTRTYWEKKNLERVDEILVAVEKLRRRLRNQDYDYDTENNDEDSIQSSIDDYMRCIDSDLDCIADLLNGTS